MPQKLRNKINGQLHAYLHVSVLSPINPLCSTTPLLPPPSFLLPSPLLLSYPLIAIANAVAGAVLTALALLAAAAAVACIACAYTSWGGGRVGGGLKGVSLITGSDQKRYLNQSRVNPAGLKHIYKTLLHSPRRAKNDINTG